VLNPMREELQCGILFRKLPLTGCELHAIVRRGGCHDIAYGCSQSHPSKSNLVVRSCARSGCIRSTVCSAKSEGK
jgi:hypothetical protein